MYTGDNSKLFSPEVTKVKNERNLSGGGALKGAASGAAIGAVAGPWGAAIGAGIGGLIGAFSEGGEGDGSGDTKADYRKQLAAFANKVGGTPTPQIRRPAFAAQSGFRYDQRQLIDQLRDRARGVGPSAAEIQMRSALDRAAQAQQGIAASATARGVSSGAAQRQASNQVAALQAQGARDASLLRAQEQANYLQQYAGAVQGARGQDEEQTRFNAAQANDVAKANVDARLRALGITSQAQLQALIAAMSQGGGSTTDALLAGAATAAPAIAEYYKNKNAAAAAGRK